MNNYFCANKKQNPHKDDFEKKNEFEKEADKF